MGHHHHHHLVKEPNQKNILISVVLNLVITIAEFVGGIFSNSLALISDATHNLSDTLALILSYFALRIGKRSPSESKTFGYKRIEILAALFNATVLIAISIFLFWEAYERFRDPKPIKEGIMFVVATIGLLANLISVFLLRKDSKHNLNIRAAYLHLFGDTLSSVAVVLGAILIHYFKIYWIDPLLTVLIGLFIIKVTYGVLKETIDILMASSPKELNIELIRKKIEQLPDVSNIHHIHAWKLTDTEVHFECHVDLCANLRIKESDQIRMKIEKILKDQFQIHHVTIQIEYDTCTEKESIANSNK
ncbi:MAG: cation diffusion facilitator family transporter [Bacteroidales bacterium]|nr:cation diffusion facilitator family transporter [Bacteroidales bacterium]